MREHTDGSWQQCVGEGQSVATFIAASGQQYQWQHTDGRWQQCVSEGQIVATFIVASGQQYQ